MFANKLEQFGTTLAIIDQNGQEYTYDDLAERVDAAVSSLEHGTKKLAVVIADNSVGSIIGYLAAIRAGHAVYLCPDNDGPAFEGFSRRFSPEFMIEGRGADPAIRRLDGSSSPIHPELCTLLGTSGSSGTSKLVRLSYQNVQSNCEAIAEYLGLSQDERAFLGLKLSYSYGMSVLNSHLQVGATVILSQHSANSDLFWQQFDARQATSFAGVPYTFEMILRRGTQTLARPTLRYATQAGGKMQPDMVRTLAELGRKQGWKLFVMYGQTEAAPRIAYLPPELAAAHPDAIGIPIPGGVIELRREDGSIIDTDGEQGELVYRGPNVMMGYAQERDDLSRPSETEALATGDLAVRGTEGLFRIVGRKSRIVKPFGLRINLDDLERDLANEALVARCTGDDQRLVVAVENRPDERAARAEVSKRIALPVSAIDVVSVESFPLLPNGKVDYRALVDMSRRGTNGWVKAGPGQYFSSLLREFTSHVLENLNLKARHWDSVAHIFAELLDTGEAAIETESFSTLAGDSLNYVQVAMALEEYLEASPPTNWVTMTVGELEQYNQVLAR